MVENINQSSITIKQTGKIVEKNSGKTITQDFTIKIYTDKLGVEAEQELRRIKESFDSKVSTPKENNPSSLVV